MPGKEYAWKVGDPPPFIEAHSLTKHKVLEDYLYRCLHILTQHPMLTQFKLTLVDGFAGGGLYQQKGVSELQLGSPLQFLKTAEAALAHIPLERRERGIKNDVEIQLHYYFVEKQKSNNVSMYACTVLSNNNYKSALK